MLPFASGKDLKAVEGNFLVYGFPHEIVSIDKAPLRCELCTEKAAVSAVKNRHKIGAKHFIVANYLLRVL